MLCRHDAATNDRIQDFKSGAHADEFGDIWCSFALLDLPSILIAD
jgi:hypothetical protein